jgi:hypothetical protein
MTKLVNAKHDRNALLPIDVTDGGIVTLFNNEHPSNVSASIVVILAVDEKVTLVIFVHLLNAPLPIVVIVFGIVTELNAQSLNTSEPIVVIDVPNVIFVKLVHPLNASFPIDVMLSPIIIVDSVVLFLNAELFMEVTKYSVLLLVTLFGIVILDNDVS